MNLKIESDEEHAAALARVLVLMKSDPAVDSPEGEELDRLARLVEEYEMRRWPL
jgi:antitoxin component HigA of HigAB toxin-antitoxin module